jgi:acetyl esterase/lipase
LDAAHAQGVLHRDVNPGNIAIAGGGPTGPYASGVRRLLPVDPRRLRLVSPRTLALETKRDVDPLLSRELLEPRVTDYTSGQDAALELISPVFADLSGLPPLIIQAGSHEVLLDDAVRLARQAATADVEVTLDISPRVPHVFEAYHPILDEAAAALDRAGQFLSARLAGAELATA